MFRGTAYAIGEIIWWCLASLLIGFLIGWMMRRWFLRDTLRREFETRLAGERANTARFQTALADRDAEVTALLSELKAARERADSGDAENVATVTRLRGRVAELESSQAASRDQPGGLSSRIADGPAPEPASGARGERAGVLGEATGGPSEGEDDDPDRAPSGLASLFPDEPSREDAVAAMAAIAERTRGLGPDAEDDLKLIRGIGPKIEVRLKGMGITSYRQIAGLDAAETAVVAAALESFPDRIERDDWIGGAAEQHRLKYGETL